MSEGRKRALWRWLFSWDDDDPADPSGVRFPPWLILAWCVLMALAGSMIEKARNP